MVPAMVRTANLLSEAKKGEQSSGKGVASLFTSTQDAGKQLEKATDKEGVMCRREVRNPSSYGE